MDWKTEYQSMKLLNKKQIQLLEDGAKSLSQSWILGAMWSDYKRLKGIKSPPPPDCSSSFSEWNNRVNDYEQGDNND